MSVGSDHNCVILSRTIQSEFKINNNQYATYAPSTPSNYLLCFGLNNFGQPAQNALKSQPRLINLVQSGANHNCQLTNDGILDCWGVNTHHQCDPPPYTSLFKLIQYYVSVGRDHTCAIISPGTPLCFGNDDSGKTDTPAAISGNTYAISAGSDYTCAVHKGKGVICWGSNRFRQLDVPKQ